MYTLGSETGALGNVELPPGAFADARDHVGFLALAEVDHEETGFELGDVLETVAIHVENRGRTVAVAIGHDGHGVPLFTRGFSSIRMVAERDIHAMKC